MLWVQLLREEAKTDRCCVDENHMLHLCLAFFLRRTKNVTDRARNDRQNVPPPRWQNIDLGGAKSRGRCQGFKRAVEMVLNGHIAEGGQQHRSVPSSRPLTPPWLDGNGDFNTEKWSKQVEEPDPNDRLQRSTCSEHISTPPLMSAGPLLQLPPQAGEPGPVGKLQQPTINDLPSPLVLVRPVLASPVLVGESDRKGKLQHPTFNELPLASATPPLLPSTPEEEHDVTNHPQHPLTFSERPSAFPSAARPLLQPTLREEGPTPHRRPSIPGENRSGDSSRASLRKHVGESNLISQLQHPSFNETPSPLMPVRPVLESSLRVGESGRMGQQQHPVTYSEHPSALMSAARPLLQSPLQAGEPPPYCRFSTAWEDGSGDFNNVKLSKQVGGADPFGQMQHPTFDEHTAPKTSARSLLQSTLRKGESPPYRSSVFSEQPPLRAGGGGLYRPGERTRREEEADLLGSTEALVRAEELVR